MATCKSQVALETKKNAERAGKKRLTESQRKKLHSKKDGMLEKFEPPNPIAWPDGSDITDDFGAFTPSENPCGTWGFRRLIRASGEVLNSSNDGACRE